MNVASLTSKSAITQIKSREKTIGAITPFSSLDYPGYLSAVIFFQGCPWRCRYCYNTELWDTQKAKYSWLEAKRFLEERCGLLEAVVFSGGEPTTQFNLEFMMEEVKQMGFKVALHTAGMYPQKLASVLKYCDWVAMDIKAPFYEYEKITRVRRSGVAVRQSVHEILASGCDYEFRTTWHTSLLSVQDIKDISDDLRIIGVKNYVLQAFSEKPGVRLMKQRSDWSHYCLPHLIDYLQSSFEKFSVREERLVA